MRELRYLHAVKEAITQEMERDDTVFVMGEDVRHSLRGATKDLVKQFGEQRVVDMPISEQAFTGMATGVLLAMARAMGEVAPILFTGVTFYLRHLPKSPLDKFMALPYHLFALATQHEEIAVVRPIAFGTAFVLLLMVLL